MITKYCAFFHHNSFTIKKKTFDRETKTRLYYDKTSYTSKLHSYMPFFDTFQEAKDWLIEVSLENLQAHRRYLQLAQSVYGNAKGLKEGDVK